jgi:hypothetical protein
MRVARFIGKSSKTGYKGHKVIHWSVEIDGTQDKRTTKISDTPTDTVKAQHHHVACSTADEGEKNQAAL